MQSRSKEAVEEAQLLAMLASLKVKSTPEADFESRFLYDFHDRVVRETVCCPAHLRVWDHLLQFVTNFGKKRLVFGASTLGAGVLAMGYMVILPSEDVTNPRVQVAKRFDDTVSFLVPGLARDCDGCTSIRVGTGITPGTDELLHTTRLSNLMRQEAPYRQTSDFGGVLYSERGEGDFSRGWFFPQY